MKKDIGNNNNKDNGSGRIKTGLLVMSMGLAAPMIEMLAHSLMPNDPCTSILLCAQKIKIEGNSISACTMLFFTGCILMLPITNWISSWRGNNKDKK